MALSQRESVGLESIPSALRVITQLGEPLRVFPNNPRYAYGTIRTLNSRVRMIAIVIAVPSVPTVIAQTLHSGIAGVGAAIAMIALVAAWLARSSVRNRRRSAVVFENGVAISDPSGVLVLPWPDIRGIQSGTIHHTGAFGDYFEHVYNVDIASARSIVLNDWITDVESFAATIAKVVASLVYPRAIQALQKGESFQFGKVTVVPGVGMRLGGNGSPTYAWTDIERIDIASGFMVVHKRGARLANRVAVSSITNLDALIPVLRAMLPDRVRT